ncbi:MAG: hypothetical protein HYX48_06430 [Chlamydiales bacterium]|nr:hypothetical protein [Chlamydiales bacterium]
MRWMLLFLFLLGSLSAKESKKAPIFVSLGADCEVANLLRENQLYPKSYPFDCIRMLNNQCLIRVLDEDFFQFLDEECCFQHPFHNSIFANSRFEIEFEMDRPFDSEWQDFGSFRHQIEHLDCHFKKRISRFRKLAHSSRRVFFIRAAFDSDGGVAPLWGSESHVRINDEQAWSLREALDRFFPNLRFTLVVINFTEESAPKIRILNGIIECKIRRFHKREDFKRLCNILLNLRKSHRSDLAF